MLPGAQNFVKKKKKKKERKKSRKSDPAADSEAVTSILSHDHHVTENHEPKCFVYDPEMLCPCIGRSYTEWFYGCCKCRVELLVLLRSILVLLMKISRI